MCVNLCVRQADRLTARVKNNCSLADPCLPELGGIASALFASPDDDLLAGVLSVICHKREQQIMFTT
jgi:hypothetical protein